MTWLAPDELVARIRRAAEQRGSSINEFVTRAGIHGLRACDAVQLASAKAATEAIPDCRTVAAFDDILRRAAAKEGFALIPG